MNRTEFEALLSIPDKVIRGDVRFSRRHATAPALVADDIDIENAAGVQLRLNITFNPEVGSKTFNVHVPGVGPICRLDVDGPAHRPAGRSHKHALWSERCPDRTFPTMWRIVPSFPASRSASSSASSVSWGTFGVMER